MKDIYVLVHNIRSLYNIGSIFRTCDAVKIKKLFLTGYCGTPPNKEISKSAIEAQNYVEWDFCRNPVKIVRMLKAKGVRIVGLEKGKGGVSCGKYKPSFPLCLVLGNEVLGVPKEILKLCDDIIFIPMFGKKESLNVSVALGIALYKLKT